MKGGGSSGGICWISMRMSSIGALRAKVSLRMRWILVRLLCIERGVAFLMSVTRDVSREKK